MSKSTAKESLPASNQRMLMMSSNPLSAFDIREFACGWGAAFVNITATYPIHKIIFRQMLHGVKASSAFEELRHEGISFLYRGMFPPLAQKTLSLSLMFGVYEGTRKPLVENLNVNPYVAKVWAGIIAGTVETALMPFERIQTLLADSAYHTNFKNTPQAFKYVWLGYGFRELYRGLLPILFRNGPSNSVFFVLREEAHARLPHRDNSLYQSIQEFFAGALIGAFTSSVFYPLNVVKVYMQSTIGGPYVNFVPVLIHIYKERGCKWRNVYKGVSINCTRAFFSWGIMNMAYEQIKKMIY
ncbi:mitochondrial nicotinamide adenine dinucleotide transporter SLC25A51 [Lutzomyia longipalpis]|uniref:mitochondrial nicotinamide adenine dinucleotide transporter SLC25A51 n=1 Tax=Lutzomyia longipalpis TaxID=7200 RepID=UPI002483D355|nr:mitochondrial nicotinamide adenine dinucleotide transporter SLC25A51 [Lutzomyia longipalpis]XP_055676953.1 mitochondrial nicotinamide adenine dinucleotide transporter SLC25A51 [Lutzomyia longipalpis]XP_055676954.1 mitochondrial nicotinamide adenine dinucleotide transporter SLC25A51 [Lutzomyia longipalpis]